MNLIKRLLTPLIGNEKAKKLLQAEKEAEDKAWVESQAHHEKEMDKIRGDHFHRTHPTKY